MSVCAVGVPSFHWLKLFSSMCLSPFFAVAAAAAADGIISFLFVRIFPNAMRDTEQYFRESSRASSCVRIVFVRSSSTL